MPLSDLSVDFDAAIDGSRPIADQLAGLDPADLRPLTTEMYDRIAAIVAGVSDPDVVFIPADPAEDGSPGWNLAHVVAHATAGLEENALQGSTLARGAEITGRPRYETPWEEITTAAQLQQRLAESRRLTLAFLDAWPDSPHLDATHDHEAFGPMAAVAYHALGLVHAKGHLDQLAEIVRQAPGATAA